MITTTLSDGSEVVAVPTYDAENAARAAALGYGRTYEGVRPVAAMTADHDATHQALAHLLGLADSPTLRIVAGLDPGTDLGDYEERVVFLFQAMLNGRDVLGMLRDELSKEARNVPS